MSKQNNISEQIRKYLNGELDARAMHRLEKEALNDPFLMDALEGYEGVSIEQENNLEDIHSRLRDRIGNKERRIIPWRMLTVAASILIVLGIGGLWLINSQPVIKQQVIARVIKAQPNTPAANLTPKADSAINTAKQSKKHPVYASLRKRKKSVVTEVMASSEGDGAPAAPTENSEVAEYSPVTGKNLKQPDIDSSNEVVVTGYGTKKRKDVTAGVSTSNSAQISGKDLSKAKASTTATGSEEKVSGLQVNISGSKTLTGTVTSKEDGLPLPGVTVKIKGTSIGTQTNSNGEFLIDSVPKGSTLELTFIGYERQNLVINRNKVDIAMVPAGKQLGEVVVTGAMGIKTQSRSLGYATATVNSKELNQAAVTNILPVTGIVKDETGAVLPGAVIKVNGTSLAAQTDANGKFTINNVPKNATLDVSFIGYISAKVKVKKADSLVIAMQPSGNSLSEVAVVDDGTVKRRPAQPIIGLVDYNSYLSNNAKSPDGKSGTVKLSFIVNSNNSLSDFKIIKSVSVKTDSAAILLVKNGPVWYRNKDANPQKVKLKIKFNGK